MATKVSGYDSDEFVESPPDDLKCLICLCVARDPLQHGEGGCGKIYCRNCLIEHKKTNNKCLNCCRTIKAFEDVRSNRDIQSLRVWCKNKQYGCQWMGERRLLEGHLKGCGFQKIPCPNECTHRKRPLDIITTEVIKIYRKDIDNHLRSECERRQYTCPHCGEIGEYERIMGLHIEVLCPKIKEECLNSYFGCEEIFPRERKDSHLSVCPYTKLDCKYRDFGCHVKPFRKDLEAHQNDDQLHLSITLNTLLVVQKQCAKLTEECGVLRTQQNAMYRESHRTTPRITFKIRKFSEYKANEREYTSTPFFTHPEGYKVAIKIYANGTLGTYRGTHMTVSLHLMRGEYDDQLEFPFKGYFRIQLLNQLEDENHCEWTYSANGNESGCEKVEDENRYFDALTFIDFIKHTDLSLSRLTNCQYLKDDCLVFRVFVQVPTYKPWLQCTTTE